MLELRGYQTRGVEIFGEISPRRFFFTWDMGAGKTVGAIAVANAYHRSQICVICPAVVRETWVRTFREQCPDRKVASILYGINRIGLTKKQREDRVQSHMADVQVVSYDLIAQIRQYHWDMIIVDEFHNLRSPKSRQSKAVRHLFRCNPEAYGLGLSGTPIPNEAQQLWNPVDIFFPGRWGSGRSEGEVPYAFLNHFCKKEVNEYGTKFFGIKDGMRPLLAQKFGKVSYRVTQEEFAKYLPPLFVEPVYLQPKQSPLDFAGDWYEQVSEETPHIGIYTHLRKTAESVAELVDNPIIITGDTSAQKRDGMLYAARQSSESTICGTTHALKEGISLSFQKAALVLEWTTRVDEVVQFIARFARQDSTSQAPTRVQIVVGPNDVGKLELLQRRIADITSVIKASRSDKLAQDAFVSQNLTDEQYADEVQALVEGHAKRSALWGADEDEVDDGDE